MKKKCSLLLLMCFLFLIDFGHAQDHLPYWPEIKKESKTWTRWWWMGNAVDKKNLTRSLVEFHKAGIGGVEIEPLYGVKGQESKFIDFLSPKWMAMLEHTLSVADSLGMGVDLTLGTGWPWGGPQVGVEDAATRLLVRKVVLKKGAIFSEKISALETGEAINLRQRDIKRLKLKKLPVKLQGVYAFNEKNNFKDLTPTLVNDSLHWKAKGEEHYLYFVFEDKTEQRVKRAAPGGEGWVLDHFSKKGLENYLSSFSKALTGLNGKIRSVFNDSYEVYGADYTKDFFEAFIKYRGYDLKPFLNRLLDGNDNDISNRLRGDYRATLSDLMIEEFNPKWNQWSKKMGVKTKLQAHGSPGNLIDLYAAADIPECETFGSMPYDIKGFRRIARGGTSAKYPNRNFRAGDADPIMIRFSSSAAHIAGRKLVSSETFTWLREHFRTALSQCKPEVEDLFVNGINHVFLHGSTYSPEKADWPGWKFYASVNFNAANPIWEDAPALFGYISKVQSMLQLGKPDNDILLYWPVHDSWGQYGEGNRLLQFEIHKLERWLSNTPFYQTANQLRTGGYSFDYISDRFLDKAKVVNGAITLPGGNYKTIVIPQTKHIPLETLQRLIALRFEGAKVIFLGVPQTVPGFLNFEEKEKKLQQLFKDSIDKVHTLNDLERPLKTAGVSREELVNLGLKFIRREHKGQKIYFIVNHTQNDIDEFVSIDTEAGGVLIMSPLTGKVGKARVQKEEGKTKIRLALASGESLLLKTYKTGSAPRWEYLRAMGREFEITGVWDLNFLKGGPTTDFSKKLNQLTSWTELGEKGEAFSGTAAYEIEFEKPTDHKGPWLLKLGDVRESAKIWLNNKYIGTLWSNPYQIVIDHLMEGKNQLRIQVTNSGSNRIKAKEARGEEWKLFYDINMVGLNYKPFDSSRLDILDSGLLENPILIPLELSE